MKFKAEIVKLPAVALDHLIDRYLGRCYEHGVYYAGHQGRVVRHTEGSQELHNACAEAGVRLLPGGDGTVFWAKGVTPGSEAADSNADVALAKALLLSVYGPTVGVPARFIVGGDTDESTDPKDMIKAFFKRIQDTPSTFHNIQYSEGVFLFNALLPVLSALAHGEVSGEGVITGAYGLESGILVTFFRKGGDSFQGRKVLIPNVVIDSSTPVYTAQLEALKGEISEKENQYVVALGRAELALSQLASLKSQLALLQTSTPCEDDLLKGGE